MFLRSFRRTYRSFRMTVACSPHRPQALTTCGTRLKGSALSIGEQPLDFEVEHSRRIEPQNPRALVFVEAAHLPLDRLGGMGPRALMMWIVIGPQEVVYQVELQCQSETRAVFLERHRTVGAKIFAGQHLELGIRPHVMLDIGLIHGVERPGYPSDARFDRGKLDPGETFQHS